jgi:hypothetical protein
MPVCYDSDSCYYISLINVMKIDIKYANIINK